MELQAGHGNGLCSGWVIAAMLASCFVLHGENGYRSDTDTEICYMRVFQNYGYLFGDPHKKDHCTYLGVYIGAPYLGKLPHILARKSTAPSKKRGVRILRGRICTEPLNEIARFRTPKLTHMDGGLGFRVCKGFRLTLTWVPCEVLFATNIRVV